MKRHGILIIAIVLLAACGGGGGTATPPQTVTSVTMDVDQNGGTLVLGKLSLTIPPGALQNTTSITITKQTIGNVPEIEDGILYEFEPEGLQFNTPVTLILPTPSANRLAAGEQFQIVKYSIAPDYTNTGQMLDYLIPFDTVVDSVAGVASTTISGFSRYGIIGRIELPPTYPSVIVSAVWDPCTRQTDVKVRGDTGFETLIATTTVNMFVQRRSAQDAGMGQGLVWQTDFIHPASQPPGGSLGVYGAQPRPAPGESAYTYEYTVGFREDCFTQTCTIAEPEIVTIGAPEILLPGKIENFVVTSRTASEVSLEWDHTILPGSRFDTFELRRVPPWPGFAPNEWRGTSRATRYTDIDDVQPGTQYDYFVRAVNTASCPTSLVSSVAATSTSGTVAQTMFRDGSFDLVANWTEYGPYSTPPSAITMSNVRRMASGNPGDYLQMGIDALQNTVTWGMLVNETGSYDPGDLALGPIRSIDFDFDVRRTAGESGARNVTLVVRQDGFLWVAIDKRRYLSQSFLDSNGQNWVAQQITGLQATDFVSNFRGLDTWGQAGQPPNPDFTVTGSPIYFGVVTQSSPFSGNIQSVDVDNFKVTVFY